MSPSSDTASSSLSLQSAAIKRVQFLWDVDTGNTWFTPGWYQLLGFAGEEPGPEVAAQFWINLMHPDDQASLFRQLQDLQDGASDELFLVHRMRHHDGRLVNSLCQGVAVRDENGRLTQIQGEKVELASAADVEAKLHQALRQSEDHRQLLDIASRIARVGYWETDLLTRATRWSTVTYEIFGVPPGTTITDELVMSLYDEQHRPDVLRHTQEAVSAGRGSDFEAQILRPDGARRWVHTRGVPVMEKGIVVGYRGVVQDIDAARTVLDAAQTREQRLYSLGEHFPGLGFIFVQRPGTSPESIPVVYGDSVGVWGLTAEELATDLTSFWACMPADGRGEVIEAIRASRESGEKATGRYQYLHPLRGERLFRYSMSGQPLPDGTWLWRGYTEDITEHESAISEMNGALQRLQRANVSLEAASRIGQLGYWEISLEDRTLFWSEYTYALHELPAGTPITVEDAVAFYVEEDRAQLEATVEAGVAGRTYFETNARIRTAQGQIRRLASAAEPVRNEKGVVIALRGAVRDITQESDRQEQLRLQAETDMLTGLSNRPYFMKRLELCFRRHPLTTGVSVLMIDLDRFKEINDSMGHEAGDAVLIEFANRLKSLSAPNRVLARFGGDEFAVLLESHGREEAEAFAGQVVALFEQPFWPNAVEYHSSGSVGIARAPCHANNAQELLRHADIAMYAAKGHATNRVQSFNRELGDEAKARLGRRRALENALRQKDFKLYFQPRADVATGRIIGVEALARWTENGVPVSPEDFIPLAERTGLIHPLGEWVIHESMKAARILSDLGLGHLRVALNLSTRQFRNPALGDLVENAMIAHGVQPEQLEVEITESLLMEESRLTSSLLERMTEMGIAVSLDDFGTGYSSFAYLQQLRVQALKIDRSFIANIESDQRNRRIVEAIVGVARSLGMRTVAEGVETDAALNEVRNLGCNEYQGFLLSRARPLTELIGLLHDESGHFNVSNLLLRSTVQTNLRAQRRD